MHTHSFEKLETWQKARVLRKEIYLLVRKFSKKEIIWFNKPNQKIFK